MRQIIIAAGLLSTLAFAGSAGAQTRVQNLSECEGVKPEQVITGCTALIATGRESRDVLFKAHVNRGLALGQKGKHLQAVADYDQALKIKPKDLAALQSRCWSKSVAGRLSQAILDCNAALAQKPNDPDTLEIRGFTWRKMRRFDLSIADYDAALALRPHGANALFGRGLTRRDMGTFAEARADTAAAAAIDPDLRAQQGPGGTSR